MKIWNPPSQRGFKFPSFGRNLKYGRFKFFFQKPQTDTWKRNLKLKYFKFHSFSPDQTPHKAIQDEVSWCTLNAHDTMLDVTGDEVNKLK